MSLPVTDQNLLKGIQNDLNLLHLHFLPKAWILDSGAANHVTYDEGQFLSLAPYDSNAFVVTGDGHKHQITHVGSIQLKTPMGFFVLHRVFLCKYNLLSVTHRDLQAECVFTPSRVALEGTSFEDGVR